MFCSDESFWADEVFPFVSGTLLAIEVQNRTQDPPKASEIPEGASHLTGDPFGTGFDPPKRFAALQ
jgi:hypothetical protein